MRILVVLNKYPWPVNSGDAVRNAAIVDLLRGHGAEVHVVALPQTTKGFTSGSPPGVTTTVTGRPMGTYLASPVNRLRTIAGRPYQLSVGADRILRRDLEGLWSASKFDAVLVATTYCLGALPPSALPRAVLDTHNVEHKRLRYIFDQANTVQRLIGQRVVAGARRYEAQCLDAVRITLACSPVDAEALRTISPTADVRVVPNGVVAVDDGMASQPAVDAPLLFLASLDYSANIDSLEYFLREIVPLLPEDQRVAVAGSNARARALELIAQAGPRVDYLGEVADAAATRRSSQAVVVPLRQGSGTRLKILEAWAERVPVIATTKGAEGLDATNGQHLMLADSPEAFAKAATNLRHDSELRHRIVSGGRALAEERYSWNVIGRELIRALKDASAGG